MNRKKEIILYYAKRQHNKTQYKRYEKLNTPGMQHQNEHTHTRKKIKSKEIKKMIKTVLNLKNDTRRPS